MKHIILILLAGVLVSCAGNASAKGDSLASGSRTPGEVFGSEWKLVEIKNSLRSVEYDRDKLETDGFGDIFTIQFGSDGVSGKAAPNNYTGPYQRGDGQALTIGNLAGTAMASLPQEPVKCLESAYFAYLSKVSRWELNGGTLELYTQDASGQEAVLSYISN